MPLEEFDAERTNPETGEMLAGPTPREAISNAMKLAGGGFPYNAAKIPADSDFGDWDFLPGPDIETIAEELIDEWNMVAFDAKIVFRWKRKGGRKAGRATLGMCSKLSGQLAFETKSQFGIWLAADNCRDFRLTNYQLKALIHHELFHIDIEVTDKGEQKLVIRGHDSEVFYSELERYGDWGPRDSDAKSAWIQAKLIPDGYKSGV